MRRIVRWGVLAGVVWALAALRERSITASEATLARTSERNETDR